MSNGMTRWNPYREMMTVQNVMDRFFDEWRPFFEEGRAAMGANPLALDVHEDENSYQISTGLPGLKPDQINIRQEGEYLVIEGETRDEFETPQEGQRPLVKERRYGRYSRRLHLPQNVNFEQAEATYEDGVLKLRLPKAPEAQPRTIPVKHGGNGNNNR
jgi:HSP20 family protein